MISYTKASSVSSIISLTSACMLKVGVNSLDYSYSMSHVPSLGGGTMGQKLNVSRSINYVLMGVGFEI